MTSTEYKRKQKIFEPIKRQYMEIKDPLRSELFSLVKSVTISYSNLLHGIITSNKLLSKTPDSKEKATKREEGLKDWLKEMKSIFKFHTRKIGRYIEDLKYCLDPSEEEKKEKIEDVSQDLLELNIEEFSCFEYSNNSELHSKLEDMFLDVIEIWRISQIDEKREGSGNLGIMNINISPKIFENDENQKKKKINIPSVLRPPKATKRKSRVSKNLEKDKENISEYCNLQEKKIETPMTKEGTVCTVKEEKGINLTEDSKMERESDISEINSFCVESKLQLLEKDKSSIIETRESEYTLVSSQEVEEKGENPVKKNIEKINKSLLFETPFSFLKSPSNNIVKMKMNRPTSNLSSKSYSKSEITENFSNFEIKYLKVPEISKYYF